MRARSDSGAVLVEAAISLLLLGTLVLGVIEFGYAWRQATAVEKTLQQAARTGANLADQPLADYSALQAFRSSLGSVDNMTLEYIVIYRSSTPGGAVPDEDCFTSSQVGVCNRYVASDLTRPDGQFGCGGSEPDRFWCPTSRERDRRPRPDYLGVHARFRYDGITNLLPGPVVIDRNAVYAVEPCAFGLPGC
tara:strand:- start:230 stop:805 length:576 start_codon:yes stop_codon:yes gene_type:complete